MSETMEETPAATTKVFVPIYKTEDGHLLFFPCKAFCANTYDGAFQIGLGSMIVECVLLRLHFERVEEVDMANTPHVRARLGLSGVAIIAGPLFDEAAAALQPAPQAEATP
jgi:hypothetical protein